MPNIAPELSAIYPLYNVLTKRMIPWSQEWEAQHIVVARRSFQEIARDKLPASVEAVRRKLRKAQTKKIIVRFYGYPIPTDYFPGDGVVATHLPVIACVINGEAQLEASDYVLHCKEGNFVVFPPQVPFPDGGQPHVKMEEDGEGTSDIFWLYHWKEGIICHICHSRGREHIGALTHEECYVRSQQALLCFEAMIEEMGKPQTGDLRVYKSLLHALLVVVSREFEAGNYIQPGAAVLEASLSTAEDPMLKAARYIQFHLNEPLTIDGMARKYYMSRSQFTKSFRDAVGMTFLTFLNEQRIIKAESLLLETDWPLETICGLSGLKASNLRVLLRNRTGMTPRQFRNSEHGKG